jgi:hypothetical protein
MAIKQSKKLSDYKKFIVISSDSHMPMTFDGDQFCYCSNSNWQDEHWPVKLYSMRRAKALIKKSVATRRKIRDTETNYLLVPVA